MSEPQQQPQDIHESHVQQENQVPQVSQPAPEQQTLPEVTAPADASRDHSRRKNPPPPGMSLSAYKKQLRKEKFEAEREDWIKKKKEKKKALKLEKKRQKSEGTLVVPPRRPLHQTKSDVSVIVDCGFDELMKEVEVKSLSQQVIRCYAENRKAQTTVGLTFSSFNKTLLTRFEENLKSQHTLWKNVTILNDDFILPEAPEERAKYLYFSSDSDNTIETLDPGMTYIIGGIVDKGRYKNLCKDKAEKLGLRTAKLPIDEFVKISGRRVLTTNHVFEIVLRWLELRDWKTAFETVLPPRKLIEGKPEDESTEAESAQAAEEETEETTAVEEPVEEETVAVESANLTPAA
ncbi:hypothetical protein D0Z00_000826 [Geotrichum galactomycetum]|uniref:Uncharacterized protein n=1 Tax=Geotrichum galactomycetum TaxID=27317 RepID=A0ACB6V8T3_9ASCO|nr:hypothetical protein D0Z00_000826 [Geotrichum candidum]